MRRPVTLGISFAVAPTTVIHSPLRGRRNGSATSVVPCPPQVRSELQRIHTVRLKQAPLTTAHDVRMYHRIQERNRCLAY